MYYINLLIKIIIGVTALIYIYLKVNDGFISQLEKIKYADINYVTMGIAVILLIFNWSIEAFKWKFSIDNIENIGFLKSLRITLTSITASLVTPNRLGEIPLRALLLNKSKLKELTTRTVVSSLSQLITTIFIGTISFGVIFDSFNLNWNPLLILCLSIIFSLFTLWLFFNSRYISWFIQKIPGFNSQRFEQASTDFTRKKLFILLLLSLLRFVVFSLQFYMVLYSFGIILNGVGQLLLIPVFFLFSTIIPSILISEIGVRGSVALIVFGIVSDNSIMILLASISLWLINVGIPAIFGIFSLNQFKFLESK